MPRSDGIMSQTIQNGLIVDYLDGSAAAWNYLLERKIPTPIILRVISSGSRRRESDPGPVDRRISATGAGPAGRHANTTASTIAGKEEHMNEHLTARYLPLATERTKDAVKDLVPGERRKIDVINPLDETDRLITDIWVVEDYEGAHFTYQDGPMGGEAYLGPADQVRIAIEEAPFAE